MNKFILYGSFFILGTFAGWVLSGKHWNIFFTSYIPALATLLAAFFGAKYAFDFQKDKEKKEIRKNNIANGNLAIFNLMRMANTLHVYKKKFIEKHRSSLTNFLEISPSPEMLADEINFNIEGLFFLIDSDSINFLGELMVEKSRFQSALDAINERSKVHIYEIQPTLEKAGFTQDGSYTMSDIEQMLGQRLFNTIVLSTSQLIKHVDDAIESMKCSSDKLSGILKDVFPGERIISFELKEDKESNQTLNTDSGNSPAAG